MLNSIFYYFVCFLLIGFIAFIGFQKNVFIFGLILSFIYTIIQVIIFSDLYNSNLSLILMFIYISILSIGTGAILRYNNSIILYVLLYILIFGFLVYISKIYVFPILINL